MTATLRSFAKINLGLGIGAVRADGFHDLLTVYQTIAWHDVIRVSVGPEKGPRRKALREQSEIEIRCSDPRVPSDATNTCYRIAEKTMAALGASGHVIIEIEKRLPVQGGLGGGSSNAVAALIGLQRALQRFLSPAENLRIAAAVGSDLPLFLIGGTILGLGRGEQVYPLPDSPATACVVLTPEVGVSTPKAFGEWDRRRSVNQKLTLSAPSDRMSELGREMSAWLGGLHLGAPSAATGRRGRVENPLLNLVRAGIVNDFEEVVFPEYPELREGKRALESAGAKYASLSGSGSTLYGLFASRAAAAQAVVRLRRQGWPAQATVTLPRRAYWGRLSSR